LLDNLLFSLKHDFDAFVKAAQRFGKD